VPGLRKCLLGAAATVAAVVVPCACAIAMSGSAKLTAHPKNLMVNTDMTVVGSGFPAHAKVSLRECGMTFWLAPNDPCNTENGETVEANGKGRFRTSFKVQVCPESEFGRAPTQRICYIGVPRAAEDAVHLEPAVKFKVSYP